MECSYCGNEVAKTKGKMLVLASGERKYFCKGKCQKNFKNSRKHRYADKEE